MFKQNIIILLLMSSLLFYGTSWSSPVYYVLFTHIEDNMPIGEIGSEQSKNQYMALRSKLLGVANLARNHNIVWVFQPDWKLLEAGLVYEDSTITGNTAGKNLFRYLSEDLDVVIDPHSHENGGYNYTDVAYLLTQLGVGGSIVIGGHIWDPTIPEFAEWDRFRVPVQGSHYPGEWWRGSILMGSGTPNHADDPIVSGVWRPRDRFHYFEDDPAGNITVVGQHRGDFEKIEELLTMEKRGEIDEGCMLTASEHLPPNTIMNSPLIDIANDLMIPLETMQSSGKIISTDFTTLVNIWETEYNAQGCIINPDAHSSFPWPLFLPALIRSGK